MRRELAGVPLQDKTLLHPNQIAKSVVVSKGWVFVKHASEGRRIYRVVVYSRGSRHSTYPQVSGIWPLWAKCSTADMHVDLFDNRSRYRSGDRATEGSTQVCSYLSSRNTFDTLPSALFKISPNSGVFLRHSRGLFTPTIALASWVYYVKFRSLKQPRWARLGMVNRAAIA